MKKPIAMLLCALLLLSLPACASKRPELEESLLLPVEAQNGRETEAATEPLTEPKTEPATEPEQSKEDMQQVKFYMTANGTTFSVSFAEGGSADAFRNLLREGDLTVQMSDYGSFEKVGSLGTRLPQEDTQISTTTGDVMLYQGDQIVVFYGTNAWSYSRLGRIEDTTAEALLSAFGSGDVAITFSLTSPQ